MKKSEKKKSNVELKDKLKEKKIKIPIGSSFLMSLIIFCIPLYFVMMLIYFYPITMRFIHLDTLFGLTNSFILIQDFWLILFSPLLMLTCLFVYIVSVVYCAKLIYSYLNWKSPPTTGSFVREYDEKNVMDERIKFYNYRGFIIKYPIWLSSKSPFYWMEKWALRTIADNKIAKTAYIVDSFTTLSFYEIGDKCIVYPTAGGASHMIDSIFGKLTIKDSILKDGSIQYPYTGFGPDIILEKENILLPGSFLTKRWRRKDDSLVHQGVPAKPFKEYNGIKSLLDEKNLEILEKYNKNLTDELKLGYNTNSEDSNIDDTNDDNRNRLVEKLEQNKLNADNLKSNKISSSNHLMQFKIPTTTANISNDMKSLIVFLQFFLGMLIMISTNYFYWYYIIQGNYWLLLLLPGSIYMYSLQLPFSVALIATIMLKILRKIHPPQQGIFSIDSDEYKYYQLRYWTSILPIWLARAAPIPWIDMVVYRMLGVKIGKNVCIYDTWFDIDFVEVGDHVMTSLNTSVFSHAIFQDKFIQLKTILKKNSIAGGMATVSPGTIINENAVLGTGCSTYMGQSLKANCCHVGNPAVRIIEMKPLQNIKSE